MLNEQSSFEPLRPTGMEDWESRIYDAYMTHL